MAALFMVLYSAVAYVFFLVTILYMVAFVGNLPVPLTIDAGGAASPVAAAVIVNLLLIALFGLQHSIMARPAFKRILTRFIPEPIERSTFVLASSLVLALMLWFWRPIATPVIWSVENPAAVILIGIAFWGGWLILLSSSFLINHFELFGLQQPIMRLLGRTPADTPFRTPLIYRYVRHPIYLGVLLGFWATPTMTAGHLLFALGHTAYVFIGIFFEERDLIAHFGYRYREYRNRVGMLLPWRRS